MNWIFEINIDMNDRIPFLKTYAWSIPLYGCKSLTRGENETENMEAFAIWCYRRILKTK